jgi:hypothetical protein
VLLAVMGVACFASMWIRCADLRAPTVSVTPCPNLILPSSNVAAPTLCLTLVRVRSEYVQFPPRISHAHIPLIVANLADSPTKSVLWALPRRKCPPPLYC